MGLKDVMLDGYGEWMEDEIERKSKEAEIARNDTMNMVKAKQPTLPPYLFDDDFMYKYDDFFVDEEGEKYVDVYYDNDYGGNGRRNLLDYHHDISDRNINIEKYRYKMAQRQRFENDEDYKVMMELGLI